jgi:antitoxin (DNA-binding transcriptional repressor) of toxin-antitoxin stability system
MRTNPVDTLTAMSRPTDISSRELHDDTSAALRRVERGEHLRVLVGRKPVAQLGPLDDAESWVDAEVMEARLRGAQADASLRRELDELQPDTIADL